MYAWFSSAVLLVILFAGPAAADGNNDCSAWTAAVQEREEGPALTATACAKTDTHDAILEIVCFGDAVNIRYIHAPGKGAEEFGPKRDFVFVTNKGRRAIFMTFEAMDGAFTAYLDREHPLFALLMAARTLSVEDANQRLRSQKITLKNSRDAIEKIVTSCRATPAEDAASPVACPDPQPAAAQAEPQPGEGPASGTEPVPSGNASDPAGDATSRTSGATGPSGDRR